MAVTLQRREMDTDVLIVGSGAAGTMAAIKAMAEGAKVLVVTKGPFPSGNSSIALAGYGAALGHADPRDNPQVHFQDAVSAGRGLCNEKLVRIWTTKIVELTLEMGEWGIDLVREGDKFAQRPWEGHTYPRMVHHHMTTGKAVMDCLAHKSREMGIQALQHTIVGDLLKQNDAVVGAWGINYQTGELIIIRAKAVVLATGGLGHLFPVTDNVKTATGEGYTLAFRAGAELIQMEFCHFLPTPCYPPKIKVGHVFLGPIFSLIDSGARLYNGVGERFMKRHYPEVGDAERGGEQLTRAIGLEIYEGRGTPRGGVYLDVSDVPPEKQKTEFAKIWENAARAGVDLSYQPIELTTYPHDMVGGVKIDEAASTGVPGLFAAGEAAGGAHGASRFGGSAVADALSFGAIAGQNAALYSRQADKPSSMDETRFKSIEQKIRNLLSREKGIEPSAVKRRIQSIANEYLNVGRDEPGLRKALRGLEQIESELLPQLSARGEDAAERAFRLREAIEVTGQLELAKIIATAALQRRESRGGYFGGHYRCDYPYQDDENWLKNIILKQEPDGTITWHTEPPVTED